MSDESTPKVPDLARQDAEELTADQSEEAQGGGGGWWSGIVTQAKPTIEIGVVSRPPATVDYGD